jgi:hypothetical protein
LATKQQTRAALLRKIERLEAQIEAIKRAERYGVEMRLKDVLDLADLRLRINWALSILQTGDLPDGAEK